MPSNPLLTLPNVVHTPHSAGTSNASLPNGRRLGAAALAMALNGHLATARPQSAGPRRNTVPIRTLRRGACGSRLRCTWSAVATSASI